MADRLPPSQALFVVGLLLSCCGLVLIIGPLLFAVSFGALSISLLLGAAMLVTGVGLCRTRPWAWYVDLGIVVSGPAVVLWRLLSNGAADWRLLAGALITDIIVAIVLLRAHPEQMQVRRSIS